MLAGFDVAANAARIRQEALARLPQWAIMPHDLPIKVNAYYDAYAAAQVTEFRREVDNVMVYKEVRPEPYLANKPAINAPNPFVKSKYDIGAMMLAMEQQILKMQLANLAIPPMYLQAPTKVALPDPVRGPTEQSRLKLAEKTAAALRALNLKGGSNMAFSQYTEELRKQGFKHVGEGMFSAAYAKDGVVAKVNCKPDSGEEWSQYCMDNYDEFPNLPKVYDVLRTGNRDGCAYITIMQQYDPYHKFSDDGRERKAIRHIKDDLEQYFDGGRRYHMEGKPYAALADDMRRTFAYGTRWDIHNGNFLWDAERGVAVVSDPYSHTTTKLPHKTRVLSDMPSGFRHVLQMLKCRSKHHQHLLEAEQRRKHRRVA